MPVTEADDVWTQVTLSLRSQLAESVWFSTFQDVRPDRLDGDVLHLEAPSAYVRDRILTRFLPLVMVALDEAHLGHLDVEIDIAATATADDIAVDDTPGAGAGAAPDDTGAAGAAAAVTGTDADHGVPAAPAGDFGARDFALEEAGLSTDYTFDTFVKGASNQFALAAAQRVAETPARSYNPLFIDRKSVV